MKLTEIERENRILLEKMSRILNKVEDPPKDASVSVCHNSSILSVPGAPGSITNSSAYVKRFMTNEG